MVEDNIKPIRLLSEGSYRECFSTQVEDWCVKIMKKRSEIKKTNLIRRVENFNITEYLLHKRLPKELRCFFPTDVKLINDQLYVKLVKDYDGSVSRSISEYSIMSNKYFWQSAGQFNELLIRNKIWLFDAFTSDTDLLVKRMAKDKMIPVLVDYKRLGISVYPYQLNLLFEKERRKKMIRRFNSFKQKFSG